MPVSVAIPAYWRPAKLISTIERIWNCDPKPHEILIHVDAGRAEIHQALDSLPAEIPVTRFSSETRIGPGGGRDQLIRNASCPYVASFDDDSYPLQTDYFARLEAAFEAHPDAAVISADYYGRDYHIPETSDKSRPVHQFFGFCSSYHRDRFRQLRGFAPVPDAYGCEEADLAMQVIIAGHDIVQTSTIQVFHDREADESSTHGNSITTAMVRNAALLPALRYPFILLPLVPLKWARQILNYARKGHRRGLLTGILTTPAHILTFLPHRNPFTTRQVLKYLRNPH